VLSTQNPVDLDYKALSNAGTWLIGRLQTERDKARLLDGMTSAAGGADRGALDDTISALDKREFLLHSTRADEPARFSTRWAMSYLAGPLTRDQIAALTPDQPTAPASEPGSEDLTTAAAELADDETPVAPEVADGVDVVYLDPATPWAADIGAVPGGTRLEAALVARVSMLFDDTKADLRETVEWEAFAPVAADDVDWSHAVRVDYDTRDLRRQPPDGAAYVLPDAPIANKTWFRSASADLREHLYREQTITLLANRELKLYSRIDESEADFAERCREAADEAKDEEVAQIRDRLTAKMDKLNAAIAKYEDRIDELQADVRNRRNQDLISIGSSVLGSILGGRASTSTIARSAGRAATRGQSSAQRIRSIENRIEEKNLALEDLEDDLTEAVAEIEEEWTAKAEAVEPVEIGLEKRDISVDEVSLLWYPVG
jgi:hypothetical protein